MQYVCVVLMMLALCWESHRDESLCIVILALPGPNHNHLSRAFHHNDVRVLFHTICSCIRLMMRLELLIIVDLVKRLILSVLDEFDYLPA